MLGKLELIEELKNIMRTMGSITFEASVVQTELYKMMVDVVCEEMNDDGILYHRLKGIQHRLDIVFSHFNELVNRLTIRWECNE